MRLRSHDNYSAYRPQAAKSHPLVDGKLLSLSGRSSSQRTEKDHLKIHTLLNLFYKLIFKCLENLIEEHITMPRETDLPEIEQIFLSATAQDCLSYREALKEAVESSIEKAKIFLQEDWAEAGKFVVDVCKSRVEDCDGYFGLFGHRYGWIPPGFNHSITELEFRWAVERWQKLPAPIFILLPQKGSQADIELISKSEPFLAREFPDPVIRELEIKKQEAFVSSVVTWASKDGLMLIYYDSLQRLVQKAPLSILNWNLDALRQAKNGRRLAQGDIPAEELGRIGRDDQISALNEIMEDFLDQPKEPAMAVLVHGHENQGQIQFAHFLRQWEEWEDAAILYGQPQNPDDTESIIRWCCSQLKIPVLGKPDVESLALALIGRLTKSSVTIIQLSIGKSADRISHFSTYLWQPLLMSLKKQQKDSMRGRLFWIMIDHFSLSLAPDNGISNRVSVTAKSNYNAPIPLPILEDVTAQQVKRWLKDLRPRRTDLSIERREEIAAYATEPDGKPSNVYNRLTLHGFWAATD